MHIDCKDPDTNPPGSNKNYNFPTHRCAAHSDCSKKDYTVNYTVVSTDPKDPKKVLSKTTVLLPNCALGIP